LGAATEPACIEHARNLHSITFPQQHKGASRIIACPPPTLTTARKPPWRGAPPDGTGWPS
jgi:hypothetical protein